MIHNEDITQAPLQVLKTFRGQKAQKMLLHANHLLYKYTAYPLIKPDGSVTEFWSSVEPIVPNDPGLKGHEQRAAILNNAPSNLARARSAVTQQWNPMTNLLKAKLLFPVYAFVGQCSGQVIDEDAKHSNTFFIGGAWQLWIPNLNATLIRKV
jgi:hypothetical protein